MNLYFYPKTAKVTKQSGNPYTRNFMEALKDFYTILNANDPSSSGILNSAKYLPRIDVLLLNWIEDIPDKKGGFFQSLYFIFLVLFLKAAGKKIVWVMHNKLSHYPHNLRIKKFLFSFLTARADLIITHAREGVIYAKSASGKENLNIRFFPHPTMPAKPYQNFKKETDVLIWGAISPYKAIDKFLAFLYENHLEHSYSIRISGKISSAEYREELIRFQNNNIRIEDGFVDKARLEELIRKSRVVLFTYSSDTILSSGALVDTLGLRANILGPDSGNFSDLVAVGLISVYKDYHDLIKKLDGLLLEDFTFSGDVFDRYFGETSWNRFAAWINEEISALNIRAGE